MFDLEPEERARLGLFLSFQSPIAIPGVSNIDFLRLAYNSRQKALGKPEVEPLQFYGEPWSLHVGLELDRIVCIIINFEAVCARHHPMFLKLMLPFMGHAHLRQ